MDEVAADRSSGMFRARLGALSEIFGFVERFCARAGSGGEDRIRLTVVLEELFTNTVRHGHQGDCDAPVWIGLSRAADRALELQYEDTAPAFNPLAHDAPLDAPVEERRIGGVGVALARQLGSTPGYAYIFGRNCLRLRFPPRTGSTGTPAPR